MSTLKALPILLLLATSTNIFADNLLDLENDFKSQALITSESDLALCAHGGISLLVFSNATNTATKETDSIYKYMAAFAQSAAEAKGTHAKNTFNELVNAQTKISSTLPTQVEKIKLAINNSKYCEKMELLSQKYAYMMKAANEKQ